MNFIRFANYIQISQLELYKVLNFSDFNITNISNVHMYICNQTTACNVRVHLNRTNLDQKQQKSTEILIQKSIKSQIIICDEIINSSIF